MGTIVFFDLETGGTKWWPHVLNGKVIPMNPIIQIAAIAVNEGSYDEVAVFEQKIEFHPEHAELDALAINSYDEEIWRTEAVPASLANRAFDRFLRRHASIKKISLNGNPYRVASLAGHNAAAFDLPFLRAWYDQMDLFLPAAFQVLDTMTLARIYAHVTRKPFANYKLATICETLGVKPGNHDALVDIRATVGIARKMIEALKL